MNPYDHEYAFKDANLYAGGKVKLADALKFCRDKDTARQILLKCQDDYEAIFDAFLAGVDFGRKYERTSGDGEKAGG